MHSEYVVIANKVGRDLKKTRNCQESLCRRARRWPAGVFAFGRCWCVQVCPADSASLWSREGVDTWRGRQLNASTACSNPHAFGQDGAQKWIKWIPVKINISNPHGFWTRRRAKIVRDLRDRYLGLSLVTPFSEYLFRWSPWRTETPRAPTRSSLDDEVGISISSRWTRPMTMSESFLTLKSSKWPNPLCRVCVYYCSPYCKGVRVGGGE